jgi:hypothetical protein
MKYLLAVVRDQDELFRLSDEEMRQAMDAWNAFHREASEAGVIVANGALEEPATAKTVQIVEGGDPKVVDGPFAETKEQLGGFCLIDCGSLEEAIGWAKKLPLPPDSKIEVRQLRDLSAYDSEGGSPDSADA